MPAGENPASTLIPQNPTPENPTSENPTSETPASPPAESEWRREWKPPGKLGYEDYAKSMGLQTSAYKRLCVSMLLVLLFFGRELLIKCRNWQEIV